MKPIHLEIATTQATLFQMTGRLLSTADDIRRERERLLALIKAASQTEASEPEAAKQTGEGLPG